MKLTIKNKDRLLDIMKSEVDNRFTLLRVDENDTNYSFQFLDRHTQRSRFITLGREAHYNKIEMDYEYPVNGNINHVVTANWISDFENARTALLHELEKF